MIFPHPDREEWVADWGLTGGEVDILLGADMIHLFPKLDYMVEKLSLYMSFLTQRYIMMGQMPDNAQKEQLAVIRRFTEEHNGAGLHLINLPRLGYTPTQPPRRRVSLGTALGGSGRRGAPSINPAVPGIAPEPIAVTQIAPAAPIRPVAPPTDVPLTVVRRLPPSQRPPRADRTGPPYWAIPLATSKHPAQKKRLSVAMPPPKAPGRQRRTETRTEETGDLVTLRFRLSWSIPAVVGLLLYILGLLTGRSHGFPAYDCHNRSGSLLSARTR